MSRRIDTRNRWRRLIRKQQSGGMTVTAFCQRAKVSRPSFYAWQRRLRDEVGFAEVKLSAEGGRPGQGPGTVEADGIELRLPGRRCVVVRPGFDRRTLLDLVQVLEGREVEA